MPHNDNAHDAIQNSLQRFRKPAVSIETFPFQFKRPGSKIQDLRFPRTLAEASWNPRSRKAKPIEFKPQGFKVYRYENMNPKPSRGLKGSRVFSPQALKV